MAKKITSRMGADEARSPVAKSLSPEEQSIIANIQSLLNQIGQEQAPAGEPLPPAEGAAVEMAADGDSDDMDEYPAMPEGEEDEVKKSETASETADERMSELPDDDKEALTVLKALMRIGEGGSVRKASRPVDPTLAALQGVAKALRSLQRQADEQGQAIVGLIEGMGIADAVVRKSEERAPARRVAQSGGLDAQAVLKALAAQVRAAPAEDGDGGTLADALTMLAGSGR